MTSSKKGFKYPNLKTINFIFSSPDCIQKMKHQLLSHSLPATKRRLGLVPTPKKNFEICLKFMEDGGFGRGVKSKGPKPILTYGTSVDSKEPVVFLKQEFLDYLNTFFPIQKISPITIVEFEKLEQCETCLRSFKTKQNLKQHIGFEHEKKIWKCTFSSCNYEKNCTQQNFKRHQNQHKTKPFVCSKCRKSFQHKSSLKTHQETVNCSAPNNQNNQSASEMHTGKLLTL